MGIAVNDLTDPTDPTDPTDANDPEDRARRSRWVRMIAPAVAVAAVAVAALVIGVLADDDEDVSTASTTSAATTTTTTTSVAITTTTSTPASTTTVDTSATDAAVWPAPSSGRRFTDPVEAATTFATEFVGFTDPVVGEFLQGDSRSGEVEVRPRADGPVTTVLVRLLGTDDAWSVLGTATPNIEVDQPTTLTTIGNPVRLIGRARAFEGTVDVEVREDGTTTPLGTGFVTGRGDGVLGPFDSELPYEVAGTERGTVLFVTHSAEDGSVWEAAVIRVVFPTP